MSEETPNELWRHEYDSTLYSYCDNDIMYAFDRSNEFIISTAWSVIDGKLMMRFSATGSIEHEDWVEQKSCFQDAYKAYLNRLILGS